MSAKLRMLCVAFLLFATFAWPDPPHVDKAKPERPPGKEKCLELPVGKERAIKHQGYVFLAYFSKDSKYVTSIPSVGGINRVDIDSGKEVTEFEEREVLSAFHEPRTSSNFQPKGSPDGKYELFMYDGPDVILKIEGKNEAVFKIPMVKT